MMDRVQTALSRFWSDMNPKEPSAFYLAKLMAVMLSAFAIGLFVHFSRGG